MTTQSPGWRSAARTPLTSSADAAIDSKEYDIDCGDYTTGRVAVNCRHVESLPQLSHARLRDPPSGPDRGGAARNRRTSGRQAADDFPRRAAHAHDGLSGAEPRRQVAALHAVDAGLERS